MWRKLPEIDQVCKWCGYKWKHAIGLFCPSCCRFQTEDKHNEEIKEVNNAT